MRIGGENEHKVHVLPEKCLRSLFLASLPAYILRRINFIRDCKCVDRARTSKGRVSVFSSRK